MSSEHMEELMAGYVLKTLSPKEIEEFDQLLKANPALVDEMSHMQEMMALLACASPQFSAPRHLKSKILKAAQLSQPTRPVSLLSPFSWSKLLAAAVALLALGLGINNVYLRQQVALLDTTIAALKGDDTFLFTLRGTKAAAAASGSIVLDLETARAIVALTNLPTLPPQEAYYVWAFTKDKKIFCGKFNTNASGQLVAQLPIPVHEYNSRVLFMRISQEPATLPATPHKKVLVMTSES